MPECTRISKEACIIDALLSCFTYRSSTCAEARANSLALAVTTGLGVDFSRYDMQHWRRHLHSLATLSLYFKTYSQNACSLEDLCNRLRHLIFPLQTCRLTPQGSGTSGNSGVFHVDCLKSAVSPSTLTATDSQMLLVEVSLRSWHKYCMKERHWRCQ